MWEILVIEPTEDEDAIRSAYAKASVKYHPEEQQDAFIRLQAAYKSALKFAKQRKKAGKHAQETTKNTSEAEVLGLNPKIYQNTKEELSNDIEQKMSQEKSQEISQEMTQEKSQEKFQEMFDFECVKEYKTKQEAEARNRAIQKEKDTERSGFLSSVLHDLLFSSDQVLTGYLYSSKFQAFYKEDPYNHFLYNFVKRVAHEKNMTAKKLRLIAECLDVDNETEIYYETKGYLYEIADEMEQLEYRVKEDKFILYFTRTYECSYTRNKPELWKWLLEATDVKEYGRTQYVMEKITNFLQAHLKYNSVNKTIWAYFMEYFRLNEDCPYYEQTYKKMHQMYEGLSKKHYPNPIKKLNTGDYYEMLDATEERFYSELITQTASGIQGADERDYFVYKLICGICAFLLLFYRVIFRIIFS